MNSRDKGKRGEREWRDVLRAHGFTDARRGQQFSGSNESPDVVCPSLDFLHFEVKRVQALNLRAAMAQAMRDKAPHQVPVVAHRRNGETSWLVTLPAGFLLGLLGSIDKERAALLAQAAAA